MHISGISYELPWLLVPLKWRSSFRPTHKSWAKTSGCVRYQARNSRALTLFASTFSTRMPISWMKCARMYVYHVTVQVYETIISYGPLWFNAKHSNVLHLWIGEVFWKIECLPWHCKYILLTDYRSVYKLNDVAVYLLMNDVMSWLFVIVWCCNQGSCLEVIQWCVLRVLVL